MHKAKSLLILLALSLAPTAACGGSADTSETAATTPVEAEPATAVEAEPEAEPAEPTREDVAEGMLLMLTQLVEISATNAGDCAANTTAFHAKFEENQALMQAGKTMEENPEDQQWFEENYSYKFNNQAMLMRENLGDCLSDPEFQKVLAELN
tara:strand:+ start:10648 stop:11106 length:459 start_codon:yes stop_codon:yes gene_type:complete